MSDDQWRRRPDDDDEFGAPLFADDLAADEPAGEPIVDYADDLNDDTGGISFGDSDTGPLPHWSEPATGELPSVFGVADTPDQADELDVWSSFSDRSASHGNDTDSTPRGGNKRVMGGFDEHHNLDPDDNLDDITGLHPVFEDSGALFDDPTPGFIEEPPPRREQGRITIGTDPTDGLSRRSSSASSPPARRTRPDTPARRSGGRPRPPGAGRTAAPAKGGTGGRDMPTAIAVGLILAAIFVGAVKFNAWAVGAIVVVVLGLASIEYFDRVREKSYEPAYVPGIVACVAAPIVAYHYGVTELPLVMFMAIAVCAVTFIGAPNVQSNPMPNMAITLLGIGWIGMLGSFGTAILYIGNFPISTADGISTRVGTDTLCLMAIAVVANDVGALFVGSAVGKTPLRAWISPNKSVEGLVGGTILTLGAMFLVGVWGKSTSWNSTGDLLLLGAAVAVLAPIGDLTESMFKRNLGVKDFGTIVKGHGGVLDRFDGFLFVLPGVYYLLINLQPWATK